MKEIVLVSLGMLSVACILVGYMIVEYNSWAYKEYETFWQYFKAMFTGKF